MTGYTQTISLFGNAIFKRRPVRVMAGAVAGQRNLFVRVQVAAACRMSKRQAAHLGVAGRAQAYFGLQEQRFKAGTVGQVAVGARTRKGCSLNLAVLNPAVKPALVLVAGETEVVPLKDLQFPEIPRVRSMATETADSCAHRVARLLRHGGLHAGVAAVAQSFRGRRFN